MGFGGFLKGLGKVAGAVAPFAMMAIPGVGPAASMLTKVGVGAAKGLGGSLVSKLLGGDTLLAAGKGMAGVGQTAAHNRGVKLDAMMAGDEMALANERQRMAAESDLMRKMQQTNYLKSGGFKDTGSGVAASGQPMTRFDFGTRPAGASEIAASTELEKQLMNRLHNPMKLRDYDSQMDPGKVETAMNWLGPLISTIGVARGGGRYELPKIPGVDGGPTPPPVVPPAPGMNTGKPYDPNWERANG
jgi:hypothetical protein